MDGPISKNLTLDTKHQSTRTHPLVRLGELDKARADAGRGHCLVGGLVLRNQNNRGVVVLDEADFARLMELIQSNRSESK